MFSVSALPGDEGETIKSVVYENSVMRWKSFRLGMTVKELEEVIGGLAFKQSMEPFCGPSSIIGYDDKKFYFQFSGSSPDSIVLSIGIDLNHSFSGNVQPPAWTREKSISLLKQQFPDLKYFPWPKWNNQDEGERKNAYPMYILPQNDQIIMGASANEVYFYNRRCFNE